MLKRNERRCFSLLIIFVLSTVALCPLLACLSEPLSHGLLSDAFSESRRSK